MLTIEDLQIAPTEVLILLLPLESNRISTLRKILNEIELKRADRFLHAVNAHSFTIARAGLRLVLSLFCGCHPRDISFHVGPFGKLYLDHAGTNLHFNLSHSEDRTMMAFAFDGEVGVDIEKERPVQPIELAKHCFSPREQAELAIWCGDEQLRAFFRGWARKESFIKAIGRGLSCPLDGFDVSLEDSFNNTLIRYTKDLALSTRVWHTFSVAAEQGFAAALTVEARFTDFRLRTTAIEDLLQFAQLEPK